MFTGLHDKNGNEIYGSIGERGGDIVFVAPEKIYYHVIWDKVHCKFYMRGEQTHRFYNTVEVRHFGPGSYVMKVCTDNPELLEQ